MQSIEFSMLARVRWWTALTALLLLALLLNNVEYCTGAPSAHRQNSKGTQNPFLPSSGPFRVVTEVDDEPDSREFSPSGNFHFGGSSTRGFQLSGKPNPGAGTSGPFRVVTEVDDEPDSREFSPSGNFPFGGSSTRGSQLSRKPNPRAGTSGPFGVPLSAVHSKHQSGSQAISASHGSTRTGTSRSSSFPFSVKIDRSLEDQDTDDDLGHSHFSVPGTSFRATKVRPVSDDISFEDVSLESMSLGRRFHPHGIPRKSNPPAQQLIRDSFSSPVAAIANPFIVKSNLASRDSLEDQDDDVDDDDFVHLSPLVRSQNHNLHGERLSLSNDFMSQYNFVDVKGSINWGYKTDDQYQDHQVHDDGTMHGNFGWTSPEGSKVSIKYIADNGGYRVVSSSGIYTEEDDDVLLQKAMHFSEHDKAKAKIASIRNSKKSATAGIPHPSTSGPRFVTVIDDDDDFSLIGGAQGGTGNQATFGVPLPDPSVTLQRGDPSSPLSDQGFGVPLPDLSVTFQSGDAPSHPSGQGFGVALPDPGVTFQSGDTSGPPSEQGFGVPLPDASVTFQSGDTSGPPSEQGFGVPLPDPGVTFQSGDTPSHPSGQGFGVALPDPGVTFQSGDTSGPPSEQGFGVPLPDPGVTFQSGDTSGPPSEQGFGVPLPDPGVTFQSGDAPSHPSGQGFGVALPDPGVTFQSGDTSGPQSEQGFGVPLPNPDVTFQSENPSSGHGFGVPFPDPSITLQSGDPSEQEFGVFLPELGVTVQSEGPLSPSSGQGFGLPLPDPTTSVQSGNPSSFSPGSEVEVIVPGSGASSQSSSDQGFPLLSTGVADPTFGDQFGIPLSNPSSPNSSPNQGFGDTSFGVPLPDLSPSSPAAPSTTNQGSKFSIADSPSSSTGADFGIPLSGSPTSSGQGPEESSGHSFGVALSEVTPNQGFETQGSGTSRPSSHSRPTSSHQGFGFSSSDQEIDTPTGSDFGIPLVVSTGPISGSTGSNAPRGEEGKEIEGSILPSTGGGSFGISLDGIGPSSINTNQGQSLDSDFISIPNELPDDNLGFGFGLGLSSSSTGSSSSSGQSFGIPLSSASGGISELSGSATAPPKQGSSNFFIVPDDDQLIATAGSPSDGIGSISQFGAIGEDKIQTEVGLSSHGVQESSGSFVFSNNDEKFDPASVGVSLSSVSSLGANQGNTLAENSNSFGVSLSSLLNDHYPSSVGDLLQGPPFEELGSSVTGDGEGSTDFNPCMNSKIHPSLLPPECFLSAASAQPDQRIGKSLSQTDSKNEAQDSFIIVVNSDLFQ